MPGVARVDFQRLRSLSLAPDRPNVMLLARPVNLADPGKSMVLVGDTLPVPAGSRPVWLSEAAADLYNVKPGQQIALPLAGGLHQFFIAGIWPVEKPVNGERCKPEINPSTTVRATNSSEEIRASTSGAR